MPADFPLQFSKTHPRTTALEHPPPSTHLSTVYASWNFSGMDGPFTKRQFSTVTFLPWKIPRP